MASDAFKTKLLAQARAFHADAVKQGQKKKLQDYIRASSGDATHRQAVANFTKTADNKIAARNAGQQRAQTRLNKLGEGKDMCNVCGQTPCNCTHIDEGNVDSHIKKVVNIYFKHRELEDRAKYKRDKETRAKHKEGAARASDLLAKMRAKQSAANADKPKPVEVHHDYSKAIAQDYKDQEARRGIGHVRDSVELDGNMVEANSMNPGISGKRTTFIQRAIRRAQKTPQEKAMVGESSNPYVDLIDEAKVPSGLTWTGSELKKRPELVAAAARRKSYQAYLKRKAAKEQGTSKVDESSDKLYAGYQADVLSLKAKAKKQEQERGPVDIQKLAARLKAVKLKGTQK